MNTIWLLLGKDDVNQAYRRSSLGPFWITIGMLVQITTISIVFGVIFSTDLNSFLPFVALGIIFWGYISQSINDGAQSYISSEALIKQITLPFYVYVFRQMWKNLIVLGHNAILIPILWIVFGVSLNVSTFLLVPGMALLLWNLFHLTSLLAIVSVRFRDIPPMVSSGLSVLFYVTPIMWYPSLLDDNQLAHLLLGLNPFYHLLQIVKLPLLGESPTLENYLVAVVVGLLLGLIHILVYRKFKTQISFWV